MDHEITIYIEIPVQVSFSTHPAEKATKTYPGCKALLIIEDIDVPNIAKEYEDYIYQQCVDSREKET